MSLDADLSFIETQFPVSKLSKESYKERMGNSSQTPRDSASGGAASR